MLRLRASTFSSQIGYMAWYLLFEMPCRYSAIDAVAGGAKVTTQARALDWPLCLSAEETTPEALNASLDWCLSEEARDLAVSCRQRALELLSGIEDEIAAGLAKPITREAQAAAHRSKGWRELIVALLHLAG